MAVRREGIKMGPKQEPTESKSWESWEGYHAPDKSAEFNYSDKTADHTPGKPQEFHYEGNDLPAKE